MDLWMLIFFLELKKSNNIDHQGEGTREKHVFFFFPFQFKLSFIV